MGNKIARKKDKPAFPKSFACICKSGQGVDSLCTEDCPAGRHCCEQDTSKEDLNKISTDEWWIKHGLGSDPTTSIQGRSKDTVQDLADAIEHPRHYTQGHIECIEYIEDQKFGYHEANAIKYITRARWKGKELSDLGKAIWYLKRKVNKLEAS